MTEQDAQDLLLQRFGVEGLSRLEIIARAVTEEAERQNLVSRSSLPALWRRHILDSAQLLALSVSAGVWLDVGTGGGFPGLVIAALTEREVVLCEPRRLRAEFLQKVVDEIDSRGHVTVEQRRAETLHLTAETITARAVASVETLITMVRHCAISTTEWILPRGAGGLDELASLPDRLRSVFHVEHSLVEQSAVILVGRGVVE